jgi:hypothetical protein
MNKFLAITFLAAFGILHAADDIPVREPKLGEPRPTWWLSLWKHHVVVIEGTIEWDQDREPEIQIEADLKALEKTFGKDHVELFESTKKFRLGKVTPKKYLFASPGLTAIGARQNANLDFLLPIMEVKGHEFTFGAKNGDTGVFIFRYGSMMTSVPLVFDEPIPQNGIDSAKALFEHRNRFDHRLPRNIQEGEQGGAGQPATRSETDPKGGDKPQPEAEGRSR